MKSTKFTIILALLLVLVSRGNERQAKVPMFEALYLSRGIVHNVWVWAVAGLGGLSNEASRNAKADKVVTVRSRQTL